MNPTQEARVLVVCTGNVCRSPYLEGTLKSILDGTGISVTSAGTQALTGSAMHPSSASLLEVRGIATAAFRARQISAAQIAESDLIIAAGREHVSTIVRLHPRALRSTFTLLDLGDLLATVSPDDLTECADPAADNAAARVAAAATRLRGHVTPRRPDAAVVSDPIGQDEAAFAAMAAQCAPAVEVVAGALLAAVAGVSSARARPIEEDHAT